MAARVTTQDMIAWAEGVQERTRLVQAKAHQTSELLRRTLARTDERLRRNDTKNPS